MEKLLVFDRVSVRYKYDKSDIFSDLSFELDYGGRLVVELPEQGGKTSLVKLIAGLNAPHEGRIIYKGRDLEQTPPSERNIAVIYSDFALIKSSVEDNLRFGMKLRAMTEDFIQAGVCSAARLYELESVLHKKVKSLSAFEKFRVALARAENRSVDLLIADDCFRFDQGDRARELAREFVTRKKCAYLELKSKETNFTEVYNGR